YRKELKSYFVRPIAYIVIALFVGFLAWRFFFFEDQFFALNKAQLHQGFFFRLEWVLVVLVSVIGMRLWSTEYQGGTIETLMTLPLRTGAVVLGKYLAALTLILVCLLGSAGIPITVGGLGELDWGPVMGGYLGAFLFSAALLALALWISSLTSHQIIAFVITLLVSVLFVMMYEQADKAGETFGSILEQLSLASHYQAMGRGVIELRDVAFFVSFAAFFLYVNAQTVENRRYR
ncbi:MAG: ABC transporter permease, partial [Planctomycetota bacterium]|nr:ABC transporter permease [Planctomycetota bacterium]